MDKPALYSRRPILSAPLRWRVELAALCLVLAVIAPWSPWLPISLLALPLFGITVFAILYPYMDGADQSVLTPSRPFLNKAVLVLCGIGVLGLATYQLLTDDHSLMPSFFLFMQGGLLSNVSRVWNREEARERVRFQAE